MCQLLKNFIPFVQSLNLRFSTGSTQIVQKPETDGLPATFKVTPKRLTSFLHSKLVRLRVSLNLS
jgi:hypothetical protein